MRYPHQDLERKWQERWEKERVFATPAKPAKEKKRFVLDMFPYPSAAGLHVGHPEGYTATDIVCRTLRMQGYDVLHPMGWDAFGLPTENYAIKVGKNPKEIAAANIENFRRQIKSLGFSYDWEREVNTSDPSYYKWTQWLFLLLYRNGLAYKAKAPVNWCPNDRTVLANEQVVDGCCERCGAQVERKELSQWFFRITDYAERLLAGLDGIDWPERIKAMQRNWIGKSEGSRIVFRGEGFEVPVFTTRPDTLFGVTYLVLAPEHPLVERLVVSRQSSVVREYLDATKRKSELERTGTDKEKTGVALGASVAHPLTGEAIPLWTADYVLPNYGTGAVMGVPAHDERDREFIRAHPGLKFKCVIVPDEFCYLDENGESKVLKYPEDRNAIVAKLESVNGGVCFQGHGHLVQSESFNDLTDADAKIAITDALAAKGQGSRETVWHLRDWLVSRQRYWGAPIPIVHCEACGDQPVPEKDLPVTLPDDVDFRPTGESPLAGSESFNAVSCPKCRKPARRDPDTMDTFVDSSWYFLRYCSPHDAKRPFDPKAVAAWCPVDLYVGGAEHAVLHLLYARFFTMVLHDQGLLAFDEPFATLKNQGLILGEDGQKMSKSRGNVVNPDEVVEAYGADTLRLYEMFMGPLEDAKPWDTKGIVGVRRFLEKVYGLSEQSFVVSHSSLVPPAKTSDQRPATSDSITRLAHKTTKKVTEDVRGFRFNTAISAMMILANELAAAPELDRDAYRTLLLLLAPFAPHLAEECWERLGEKGMIANAEWPTYDPALLIATEIPLAVQVMGKLRDTITVPADATEDDAKAAALASPSVQKWLERKTISRVVFVKGRLLNFVTEE